jgi:hypothetical protein
LLSGSQSNSNSSSLLSLTMISLVVIDIISTLNGILIYLECCEHL